MNNSNSQFIDNLARSFMKIQIDPGKLQEKSDDKVKDAFDNASKISSGYDDEDSIEEEQHYPLSNTDDKAEDADSSVSQDETDNNDTLNSEDPFFTDEEAYIDRVIEFPNYLRQYLPSENIKEAKNSNFSVKSLRENHSEVIKTFLTNLKIDKDNICLVYKMLVEIEDVTLMSEYLSLVQKNVVLNRTLTAKRYWISLKDCPNIEEIVAPFMDEVVLVPKASAAISKLAPLKYMIDILLPHEHESDNCDIQYRRLIATVDDIRKDRAFFCFSKKDHSLLCQVPSLLTKKYDIIFRSRRYPLRYQHQALELLTTNKEMRDYIFPKENPFRELTFQPRLQLSLLNTTISSNPEQLEAIHNIIEGRNLKTPFVIFGPPGTGKTTLIVESILQLRLLYPRNRILVTAGSNSACDTIALRICKYFKSNPDLKNVNSIFRIYSKSIITKGLHLVDPELLKHSNIEDGLHYNPCVNDIQKYGIVVATLCTVGKLVTILETMNLFTHIFMDEAGASTFPEALMGIMGVKTHSNCRLILSGDHKQLGPIIKSERAAQLGLKQTLLESLLNSNCYDMDENGNYDRTLQARLRRNYRSHPEIVRLYNHLYYNNELIAEAKEEDVNLAANWCELPNPKFPIIFQAVHGTTKKDGISPSSFNNLEVQVLIWFLKRLLVDGINGRKIEQSDIGIITPYKLQNKRIKCDLNMRGWWHIESGSVETFQGKEKQVIIVSLVRSFSGLGFVGNPKRLNVILSRPMSLLILIGNPLTLRRNSDFNFVMNECKKHGTFLRKKKIRKQRQHLK